MIVFSKIRLENFISYAVVIEIIKHFLLFLYGCIFILYIDII